MFQRLNHIVGIMSARIAEFAGHSAVQVGVLVACLVWLLVGGSEAALASAMTIGSFILTQMVLNQQRRREDALHLKIDELLHAIDGARDEVAGSEHATDLELAALREDLGPNPAQAV